MIAVNLFAQPSAGKSTTAAYVFAYLKNRGCNVELITEYAKQLVYSRREAELGNQVYLLGKQYKKMKDVEEYGKVNMVITDSPLLLGALYSEHLPYFNELKKLTLKLHSEFENVNVLVRRTKPYNPSGRQQTEEQSDEIGVRVQKLMMEAGNGFSISGDEEGQIILAQTLFATYSDRIKI